MSDGKNVGRRRAAPPIPAIVKGAISAAKDVAKQAAKKAAGIHSDVSEASRHPALEAGPTTRPDAAPADAGDATLSAEIAMKRLAGHLQNAKSSAAAAAKSGEGTTANASSAGLGDTLGAIGDAVAGALEAAKPERKTGSIQWVSGPWMKVETAADDATPEEHRNRIGDAAKPGKTLIGVELGVARFADADFEIAGKLGRGYLSGAIDFVKLQGTIFADGGLEGVDFGLTEGFKFDRPAVGVMIGGQALAELIGAHYEVGYDTPTVTMLGREVGIELTARLDAAVHAYARGWLEVTVGMRNAAVIGGEAFAGASATLAGQAELAPFADVHGSVSAWAGPGAAFVLGVKFDVETGEFDMVNKGGVSPIVGAGYDWGVSVNVWELAKFASDHHRLHSDALPELQVTADDIARIIGDFCDAMSGSGEISGRALGLAFGVGGDVVAAGAGVAGAAISSGGSPSAINDAMGKAAGDVASSVGDAAKTVFGWYVQ